MVLVDSSMWIHLERARLSLVDLVDDEDVAACPIVVMEVLRGAGDAKRYRAAREMFAFVPILDAPTPLVRFEEAAQLYRLGRDEGLTLSAPDCLVATCAIAHNVPLLHNDSDFNHIARVTPLRLFTRS